MKSLANRIRATEARSGALPNHSGSNGRTENNDRTFNENIERENDGDFDRVKDTDEIDDLDSSFLGFLPSDCPVEKKVADKKKVPVPKTFPIVKTNPNKKSAPVKQKPTETEKPCEHAFKVPPVKDLEPPVDLPPVIPPPVKRPSFRDSPLSHTRFYGGLLTFLDPVLRAKHESGEYRTLFFIDDSPEKRVETTEDSSEQSNEPGPSKGFSTQERVELYEETGNEVRDTDPKVPCTVDEEGAQKGEVANISRKTKKRMREEVENKSIDEMSSDVEKREEKTLKKVSVKTRPQKRASTPFSRETEEDIREPTPVIEHQESDLQGLNVSTSSPNVELVTFIPREIKIEEPEEVPSVPVSTNHQVIEEQRKQREDLNAVTAEVSEKGTDPFSEKELQLGQKKKELSKEKKQCQKKLNKSENSQGTERLQRELYLSRPVLDTSNTKISDLFPRPNSMNTEQLQQFKSIRIEGKQHETESKQKEDGPQKFRNARDSLEREKVSRRSKESNSEVNLIPHSESSRSDPDRGVMLNTRNIECQQEEMDVLNVSTSSSNTKLINFVPKVIKIEEPDEESEGVSVPRPTAHQTTETEQNKKESSHQKFRNARDSLEREKISKKLRESNSEGDTIRECENSQSNLIGEKKPKTLKNKLVKEKESKKQIMKRTIEELRKNSYFVHAETRLAHWKELKKMDESNESLKYIANKHIRQFEKIIDVFVKSSFKDNCMTEEEYRKKYNIRIEYTTCSSNDSEAVMRGSNPWDEDLWFKQKRPLSKKEREAKEERRRKRTEKLKLKDPEIGKLSDIPFSGPLPEDYVCKPPDPGFKYIKRERYKKGTEIQISENGFYSKSEKLEIDFNDPDMKEDFFIWNYFFASSFESPSVLWAESENEMPPSLPYEERTREYYERAPQWILDIYKHQKPPATVKKSSIEPAVDWDDEPETSEAEQRLEEKQNESVQKEQEREQEIMIEEENHLTEEAEEIHSDVQLENPDDYQMEDTEIVMHEQNEHLDVEPQLDVETVQPSERIFDEDELLRSPDDEVSQFETETVSKKPEESVTKETEVIEENLLLEDRDSMERCSLNEVATETDLLADDLLEEEPEEVEEMHPGLTEDEEMMKDVLEEKLLVDTTQSETSIPVAEEKQIEDDLLFGGLSPINFSPVSEGILDDPVTVSDDILNNWEPTEVQETSENIYVNSEREKSLSPETVKLLVLPEDERIEEEPVQFTEEDLLGQYGQLEAEQVSPVVEDKTAESGAVEKDEKEQNKETDTVVESVVEEEVVNAVPVTVPSETPTASKQRKGRKRKTQPVVVETLEIAPTTEAPITEESEAIGQEVVPPAAKRSRGRPTSKNKKVAKNASKKVSEPTTEPTQATTESTTIANETQEKETIASPSKEPSTKRRCRKNNEKPFVPARATRSKKLFLSKNNPVPRIRRGESEAATQVDPVRLTGVVNNEDLGDGTSEKFKKLPKEVQRLVNSDIPESPKKKKKLTEPVGNEESTTDVVVKTEVFDDENWVIPDPILPNSRKSRKRQREEKTDEVMALIKQEITDTFIGDQECRVLMEHIITIKEEEDDPDFQIISSKVKSADKPVATEPETFPPKVIDPELVTNPKHINILTKTMWEGVNEVFMSDPAKFSEFIIILAGDSEKKGRVFKFSATVDNRLSDFDPKLIKHLASSPKTLTDEQTSCMNYITFSKTFRDKASLNLINHVITPFNLHQVVEKISGIKAAIRDQYQVLDDGDIDSINATEKILLRHFIENVMKMAGLSQITWTTPTHVHRRLEMIYHGWRMFLLNGGFFRVLLSLNRKDVKKMTEEFRGFCSEYLTDIEANYTKAKEIYSMSHEDVLKLMQEKSGVSDDVIAKLDEDVRTDYSSTHTEKCFKCSLKDLQIYFSSAENLENHDKLHNSSVIECEKCYEDLHEFEWVFHRMSAHDNMRVVD
uniref:CENP-C_C domain-containing protein n=1 Tax=Caenorhabditis tropicalis TaxID=1561998 RepID=A0A1I7U886_9PELO